MAEYKTANQLPILEEVTETTYALVEDGGSLKRVSGSNLGGKGNCCVINIEQADAAPSDASTSAADYTCNMTYSELMEALQSKTLASFVVNTYAGTMVSNGIATGVYFGSDAPGIMIYYTSIRDNITGTLQFLSDNTISAYGSDS